MDPRWPSSLSRHLDRRVEWDGPSSRQREANFFIFQTKCLNCGIRSFRIDDHSQSHSAELGRWLSAPDERKNEDGQVLWYERDKGRPGSFRRQLNGRRRCRGSRVNRHGETKSINVFYNETTATTINSKYETCDIRAKYNKDPVAGSKKKQKNKE